MRVWAIVVAGTVCGGCSIHPQTEDFAREYVPEIIRKIKCEAREAILQTVGSDPQNYIMDTGLAFGFDFIMKEANTTGTAGTLGIPVPNGSVSVTLDLGEEKNRKTTQRVTVSDTFRDLVKLTSCNGPLPRENFKYPVTGEIGLLATFENYHQLLTEHAGDSLLGTFEDEVEYKTDISASLSSKLKLVAVSTRSIEASGGTAADRSDLHRVKLSFTPASSAYQVADKKRKAKKKRLAELEMLRQERSIPQAIELVGESGAPTGYGIIEDKDKKKAKRPRAAAAPVSRAQKPSDLEIKEEALRTLERSDSRAFMDAFRREFEDK